MAHNRGNTGNGERTAGTLATELAAAPIQHVDPTPAQTTEPTPLRGVALLRAIFGTPTITAGPRENYPKKGKDGQPIANRYNATMATMTYSLGGVFELACHVYRDQIIDGLRTENNFTFSVPKAGKLVASPDCTGDEINAWLGEQLAAWDEWSQRTVGSTAVSSGTGRPKLVRISVAPTPAPAPAAPTA